MAHRRRRKKSTEPKVRWTTLIPVRTAAIIENAHFNPTLKKPQYGSRSHLITALLDRHIADNKLDQIMPETSHVTK